MPFPLLPEDLDIIVIRPKDWRSDQRMVQQFQKDYHVRKSVVKQWFLLRQNHPAYHPSILQIAGENLDALPDDEFVGEELDTHEAEDEEAGDPEAEFDDHEAAPEVIAVPGLNPARGELEEIQKELDRAQSTTVRRQPRRQPHMSMPTPQRTPISEFAKSEATLSWAFPSLCPRGEAEFLQCRARDVSFHDYIRHLLLYRDRRFAQHPRWRYVVFNTLMRKQVNGQASFFVGKLHPQNTDLTVDELRRAFEDDSEQSDALLSKISRYAAQLKGTRPFWAGRMKVLEAMVRQLNADDPGMLFITESAADYHWPSLMKYMEPADHARWVNAAGDQATRVRIARDFVRDN